MGLEAPGLDTLASTLRAAGRELADLTEVNAAVAKRVADKARPGMPRATGRLVSTVRTHATPTEAVVTVSAPYARYALFGTRHQRPAASTPYGAMLDLLPDLTEDYADAAQAAADTVKGG